MGEIKAPGLKYRARAGGARVPVWCARADAIAAGYPIKTCNLSETPEHLLVERCTRLWSDMLAFLGKSKTIGFDGTLRSVLDLYTEHKDSPFHALKPGSRHPYEVYLFRLRKTYGDILVHQITGLDVMAWHETWRAPAEPGGKPRLAAATVALNVLKSALNWSIVCGYKTQCGELRQVLGMLNLPKPSPRTEVPDAAVIERARTAAHELGRPRAAFCYALQFETSARQWDLIGQWVPLSHPQPSSVILGTEKWIGPTWASIDANMVMSYTPTKTERTTGKRVEVDLSLCPMVMEELAYIPPADRIGPLVINEGAGIPYHGDQFQRLWAQVRTRAGLRATLWNRDIRAGAITEGGIAGASADDRAKLAGHSGPRMTRAVYDRDVLVSANRVAEARAAFRGKK